MELFSDILTFIKEVFSQSDNCDLRCAIEHFITAHQKLTYALLMLIIFCETGLVVTPFLPGDSLLFASGMVIASTAALNIWLLILLLIIAAILGDNVNYFIGKFLAKKGEGAKLFGVFTIRKDYLDRTHKYYEKHGGKTIIMARFIPIVRTFAPFVAGVGNMQYSRYMTFCIIGAVLWVSSMSLAGYFLSSNEFVKAHFDHIVLAIIAVSVLPVVLGFIRSRKAK
ncbi:MAG: VTT domain-containing protein [Bacteroidota bacterium]|nr:VTT domain-containing protein [Bacteroidota bacterium]